MLLLAYLKPMLLFDKVYMNKVNVTRNMHHAMLDHHFQHNTAWKTETSKFNKIINCWKTPKDLLYELEEGIFFSTGRGKEADDGGEGEVFEMIEIQSRLSKITF